MMKSLKIILLTFLAFTSGTLTVSHAKYHKVIPNPHRATVRVGKASWYSKRSPGINSRTANNEIFDDRQMTCAMWGVAFNQKLRVTNRANGKSIIVRVNDRGPHRRYVRKGRIIDLTKQAFQEIASLKKGIIDVEIEFL